MSNSLKRSGGPKKTLQRSLTLNIDLKLPTTHTTKKNAKTTDDHQLETIQQIQARVIKQQKMTEKEENKLENSKSAEDQSDSSETTTSENDSGTLEETATPRGESSRWTISKPSSGNFEASNLLGSGANLLALNGAVQNSLLNLVIFQIESKVLQEPIKCCLRVKTLAELKMALRNKLSLSFSPDLYVYNELTEEDIQIHEELKNFPNPATIKILKKDVQESYRELIAKLKEGITVKDRRYHFRTYPNCFVGIEFVDFIVSSSIIGPNTTRVRAEKFGQFLLKNRIISHVVDQHKPFRDKFLFYRFTTENEDFLEEEKNFNLTCYHWGNGLLRPTLISMSYNIVSIACGHTHYIVLSEDGLVYSKGYGPRGELGLGKNVTEVKELTPIAFSEPIQFIDAAYHQSSAKAEDKDGNSKLYMWGSYSYTVVDTPFLLDLSSLLEYSIYKLALGFSHNLLLVIDKKTNKTEVFSWGCNTYGQLGIGTTCDVINDLSRVQALSNYEIMDISCGFNTSAAITSDGVAFLWGVNSQNSLSTDTAISQVCTPRRLRGIRSKVDSISFGSNFIAVVTRIGNVYIWGQSKKLELSSTPKQTCLKNVTKLVCGTNHILAVVNANDMQQIVCWGKTDSGRLGLGKLETGYIILPHNLSLPIERVIQLSAGGNVTACIINDDISEIFALAIQKLYGNGNENELQNLIGYIRYDKTGKRQIAAKKALSLQSSNNTRVVGGLFRSVNTDHYRFELFQHSTIYNISLSKYLLFEDENISIFKTKTDKIVINNEGGTRGQYSITIPKSKSYNLECSSLYGNIPKSPVVLEFKFIGLKSGEYEALIFIDIESAESNLFFRSFVHFKINCKKELKAPEIPYDQLSGGEILGSGASGTVTKTQLNSQWVAVKTFAITDEKSPEELNAFRNEILITSNLSHPNIIKCLGVSTKLPHLALVLEFIPLKDLRFLIENQKLPIQLILKITLDIVEGMIYLHNRFIIHRDLKPDNVMIVSINYQHAVCAKLTDFGTCEIGENTGTNEVGTARYMPLEVLEPASAPAIYDRRKIDVYSFGLVVWEMVSREIPFKDIFFTADIVEAQKKKSFPYFVREWDLVDEFKEVIEDCVSLNPSDRPDFEDILISLVPIVEKYPGLESEIDKLRKKYGRRILNRPPSLVREEQVKTLENSLSKISRQEEKIVQQMEALRVELEGIQAQKKEISTYLSLIREGNGDFCVLPTNSRFAQRVVSDVELNNSNFKPNVPAYSSAPNLSAYTDEESSPDLSAS